MSRFLRLNTKAASLIGMFMAMLVVSRSAFPEAPESKLPVVKSSGLNDPKSTNVKPEPAGADVPVVDPFFILSGALLTESFDGPELDATLWSRPPWLVRNHKTIGVKIENGHLVISGPSHPEKQSHQYAGVISKYFRETDVVLTAEVQARSPINGEG
jgi:hypothetical protein